MYEVAGGLCDDKTSLVDDVATKDAEMASNKEELLESHEEVSRLRHQEQVLIQQVAGLTDRAKQIKTAHLAAMKAADERVRGLERTKADSDHSFKSEIARLTRQLAIRSPNTPVSALTRC